MLGRQQLFQIAAFLQRQIGGGFHEALELVVAGDEVGFGIDFHQRARALADGDADKAFGGHAAGLLGGLGDAFLAQPIDGGFHVAAGLVQRLLAVHHARAGLVAQVLHHAAVMFAIEASVAASPAKRFSPAAAVVK